MTRIPSRASSERGAVFIHVALALVVLLMFLAMVADYGMLMVSRNQAQNAADAAALSGARALAFDDAMDIHDRARNVAWNVAIRNNVWGEEPGVSPQSPYPGTPCTTHADDCIRVDVFRNGALGSSSMATWFAALFGVTTQGTRAWAVAEVGAANASDCLKPFTIPDFYDDPDDNGWDPGDTYNAPGYTLAAHLGQELLIRDTTEDRPKPGWFRLVDLIGDTSGGGADELRDVIRACAGDAKAVGNELDPKSGSTTGIKDAVDDLIQLDPDAEYDPISKRVVNSCADTRSCDGYVWDGSTAVGPQPDPGRSYSPRIIPLALFDPVILANEGRIVVVNIFGFFLSDDVQWSGPDKYLKGTIVNEPGLTVSTGGGTVPDSAAFTKIIRLVR